jgi:hypothetical protein
MLSVQMTEATQTKQIRKELSIETDTKGGVSSKTDAEGDGSDETDTEKALIFYLLSCSVLLFLYPLFLFSFPSFFFQKREKKKGK